MHDWSRIDPNDHHHFHGRWIFAIADALNGSLLPEGDKLIAAFADL